MASREEKVHRWGADGEEIFIEVWKIWWTRITRRSKAARGCFLYQEQHSVQKEHYKADLKRIISSLDMVEKWAADDSNSFTQWFICNNSLNFVTFVTVATRINNVVLSQNGQTHIYLSPVDRFQYFISYFEGNLPLQRFSFVLDDVPHFHARSSSSTIFDDSINYFLLISLSIVWCLWSVPRKFIYLLFTVLFHDRGQSKLTFTSLFLFVVILLINSPHTIIPSLY